MKIGNRTFENYTYVMAILNVTPDSFWVGSRNTKDTILKNAEKAIKEGAAILDVGAQSSRPGYQEISAEEEIQRLEEPLYLLKKNFDIPLSVDTYFAKTAEYALSQGVDLINDIWGLTHDQEMASVIAKHNAAACIMHNAQQPIQGDLWRPVEDFLAKSVNLALASGIDREKICLDGGIGFAKDREQNWELLNNYERLNKLGYPLLLGCSRKSMFGGKVEDRLAPTVEASVQMAKKKILFVRVHDVKENAEAIRRVYEQNTY